MTNTGMNQPIPTTTCTVKDPSALRAITIALIVGAIAAAAWMVSAVLAGPWIADSATIDVVVAGIFGLAAVLTAWSLRRALGCGHCHTPQCTCGSGPSSTSDRAMR